jgi:hypothetical protein
MQNTPQLPRQSLACGYEPPADGRVHLSVWQPPGGSVGYRGPALTVCAGYSANLPEVTEAAIARAHWKQGAVEFACAGEAPSEELMDSILVLDSESSSLERWLMTPAADGGGGK